MLSKISRMAKKANELRRIKKMVQAITADGAAGSGKVRVTMNGAHRLKQLTIAQDVMDSGDPRLVADLVKKAVNEASRNVETRMQGQLADLNARGALDGLG